MTDLNERQLEELMRETAEVYRSAPEPRIEAMWRNIEPRAFAPRLFAPRLRPRWTTPLALAATLILGLGIGYWTGQNRESERPSTSVLPVDPALQPASWATSPFVGIATNYLQQTTALLIAVAGDLKTGSVPIGAIAQARDLLSTTRLLLDSGTEDPRLRELLQDLELVLAQVVRLPEADEGLDAALITQALNEREVLPRLTYYLADNNVAP